MLDLGFLPDVERLHRQDARDPADDAVLGDHAGRDRLAGPHPHAAPDEHPRRVRATRSRPCPATAQFIYQVHDLDKPEMIARILQAENSGLTIVFTRTKRAAQRVADDLDERGFDASPLHGDMQQVAREKALKRFREGKLRVLVATDVAARGIDVADVTHVINYSCPEDEKTYVHRIGRTGRAGASGIAVTFVDWADVTRWKVINKALDLPFDDPAETYSTSEHFFHDMGIPPGTKGRLDAGEKRRRAATRPRPRRDRAARAAATRARATRPAEDRRAATAAAAAPAAASRSTRRAPAAAGEAPRRDGERPAGSAAAPSVAAAGGSGARRSTAASDRSRCRHGRRRQADCTPRRCYVGGVGRPGNRGAGQATTTTVVPTGAKPHSALASGRHCRMQPWTAGCRARRGSAPARRRARGCRGSRSRRCRRGRTGPCTSSCRSRRCPTRVVGLGVDRVGAGVQVVGERCRRPGRCAATPSCLVDAATPAGRPCRTRPGGPCRCWPARVGWVDLAAWPGRPPSCAGGRGVAVADARAAAGLSRSGCALLLLGAGRRRGRRRRRRAAPRCRRARRPGSRRSAPPAAPRRS